MRDGVSEVFSALGDETRRGIYEQLLARESGWTATELTEGASISRQAIVKHLQVLERAGLAHTQRDGREVHYVALPEGAMGATAWLLAREAAWDRRLAALERRTRPRSGR